MPSLPHLVTEYATELPEGSLLYSKALRHLGNRNAINQALSRLARSGQLERIYPGIYVRLIETRFGWRSPSIDKVISALAELWGETIVPCGGAAANTLGITTQVPVQPVYLTSGPSRELKFGELRVILRHAPQWQLVAPSRRAGDAIRALAWLVSERALAWLTPEEVEERLREVVRNISAEDLDELASFRAIMPAWIAEPVSSMVVSG